MLLLPTTLSIILPCYNAAPILENSIRTLCGYLDSLGVSWEIVVVNDGSTDHTAQLLQTLDLPNVFVVELAQNRGKGRAVREGMLHAHGKYRIFTDIDLPYRLDAIGQCLAILSTGAAQAAFGNRKLDESRTETRLTPVRRLASLLFKIAAGVVIGRFDLDTQCGLKGCAGPLADRLFPLLTLDGFAFDVELCWLLHASQIAIAPVPVVLVNQDFSTVTIFGSGQRAFADVIRLAIRKLVHPLNRASLRGVLQGENVL